MRIVKENDYEVYIEVDIDEFPFCIQSPEKLVLVRLAGKKDEDEKMLIENR